MRSVKASSRSWLLAVIVLGSSLVSCSNQEEAPNSPGEPRETSPEPDPTDGVDSSGDGDDLAEPTQFTGGLRVVLPKNWREHEFTAAVVEIKRDGTDEAPRTATMAPDFKTGTIPAAEFNGLAPGSYRVRVEMKPSRRPPLMSRGGEPLADAGSTVIVVQNDQIKETVALLEPLIALRGDSLSFADQDVEPKGGPQDEAPTDTFLAVAGIMIPRPHPRRPDFAHVVREYTATGAVASSDVRSDEKLKQVARDSKGTIYALSSGGDFGRLVLELGKYRFEAIAWPSGSENFHRSRSMAYDAKRERIIIQAGRDKGDLVAYDIAKGTWSTLFKIPEILEILALAHDPTSDKIYAVVTSMMTQHAYLMRSSLDGASQEIVALTRPALSRAIHAGNPQVVALAGKLVVVSGEGLDPYLGEDKTGEMKAALRIAVIDPIAASVSISHANGRESYFDHPMLGASEVPCVEETESSSRSDPSRYFVKRDDAKALHILSAYEPGSTGSVRVRVADKSKPVLLFLGRDGGAWEIDIAPGVTVERVYRHEGTIVQGLPANAQVIDLPQGFGSAPREWRPWRGEDSGREAYDFESRFVDFIDDLRELTGVRETSFQGCYRVDSFLIPDGI